ncbi:MFS transporter [Nocardia brasiliensis]
MSGIHRAEARLPVERGRAAAVTLTTVCIALFMLLLDISIVAVALPDIQRAYDADLSALQWIVDAYTVPIAVLLLTIAVAGDRYGRKTFFVAGLGLFVLASGACALAPNIMLLNVFRAVQGCGAAAMMGLALPLLSAAFPSAAGRAKAIGVYGAVMGLATASGPVVDGVLVEYLDWRWIFLINLPIGAIALVLARRIPNSKDTQVFSLDLAGTLSATVALLAAVLALVNGNGWGWWDGKTIVLFAVAAVAALLFVLVESRVPSPMVDLRLVARPDFAAICVAGLLAFATVTAAGNYLALFFVNTLHMSALHTGLALVPMSVGALVTAPIVAALQRFLPNMLWYAIGLAAIAGGAWSAAHVTAQSTWTHFVPVLICSGIALGIIVPTTSEAALRVAANVRPGMTSGVASTARQIGTALGVATLGAVFGSAVRSNAEDALRAHPQVPDQLARGAVDVLAAGGSIEGAATAARVPPLMVDQLVVAGHTASAAGIGAILTTSALLAGSGVAAILIAALVSWLSRRGVSLRANQFHGGLLLAVVVLAGAQLQSISDAQADPGLTQISPAPDHPKLPEKDPEFYRPAREQYAGLAPGQAIKAREIHPANFSAVPVNVDAWQLSFRSANTRDEPIPAVATVLKPRGSVANRPLLAFQMAEDSLGSRCAGSYTVQSGSLPSLITGQDATAAEFLVIAQTALSMGWAVVIPDHEGPDSAFGAGPLAGRITLDAIRAAESFPPMELPGTATQVGMFGYSGGTIPTGHAAELHASYAPELHIVGAAEGGVVADYRATAQLANGNVFSGVILAGLLGYGREYPEYGAWLNEHLNPVGRALVAAKEDLCGTHGGLIAPFVNLTDLTDGTDLLNDPFAAAELARGDMGKTVPDLPLYLFQSNPDYLVPVGQVNALVDKLCEDSAAQVVYTRDHFSEHVSMELLGVPRALLWLRDRFAEVPMTAGCTRHDVGSMALDPVTRQQWISIVGAATAALLGQPLG